LSLFHCCQGDQITEDDRMERMSGMKTNEKCMEHLHPETSEKQAAQITGNGWQNTVKLKLKELQREYVYWIHLDHDDRQPWSFVKTIMSTRVP
jgi:hypothetical protein